MTECYALARWPRSKVANFFCPSVQGRPSKGPTALQKALTVSSVTAGAQSTAPTRFYSLIRKRQPASAGDGVGVKFHGRSRSMRSMVWLRARRV